MTTEEEILKKHPSFNVARVDALLKRLAKLGIEPDKYNLQSRYEEPRRRDNDWKLPDKSVRLKR
ncbi:MAG: hypothetical protein ACR2FY_05730 [Pirellulaceae bacterium]